ncbi:MAG: Ig-like domain-containing protein [Gemmatimonadota bacterium]
MSAPRLRSSSAVIVVLAPLLIALSGCGSNDSGTAPDTRAQVVDSITVTATGAQIAGGSMSLIVGDSARLTGTPRNASGNVIAGKNVQWSVADTSIASIALDGLLRGVHNGTTSVTARIDTMSTSVVVTVIVPPVAKVALTLGSASIAVGQTDQATASISDGRGNVLTDRPVTFASSDTTVATIAATGLLTAVKPGGATITATSEGVSGTAQLQVVTPIAGVPSRLAAQSWSIISAPAAIALPSAPRVVVLDGLGQPVANVPVVFAVTAGGGKLVPSGGIGASTSATVTTGPSGVATSPSWTLGPDPGVNSVNATVAGIQPITFTVTATPYAPLKIELVGPPANTFSTDTAGVVVCVTGSLIGSWYTGAGVRSVQASYGNGLHASLVWELPGPLTCGSNRWVGVLPLGAVTAGAVIPITVTAVDTAGDSASVSTSVIYKPGPVAIVFWSSPPPSAPAGTVVQLSVQVVDANRHGIANIPVTFTVTGGGSIGSATVISGVEGITTTNWTLGSTPGTNAITATATGTSSLTSTVEGTPP